MRSVTYVSRHRIEPPERERIFGDLQTESMARNSRLNITGVLIVTPDLFAGRLEGPADNVDAVMASILADPRHHDVRMVQESDNGPSRSHNWRMRRYSGESAGEGGIAAVIAAAHAGGDPFVLRRLERLIDALADSHASVKI